jgi:hypothetical protein
LRNHCAFQAIIAGDLPRAGFCAIVAHPVRSSLAIYRAQSIAQWEPICFTVRRKIATPGVTKDPGTNPGV